MQPSSKTIDSITRGNKALIASILSSCKNESIPVTPSTASVFLAQILTKASGRTVIHISESMSALETAHRNLSAIFSDKENEHLYFPAHESTTKDKEQSDPETSGFRLSTLSRLANMRDAPAPMVITTCIQALLQLTIQPKALKEMSIALAINNEIDTAALNKKLQELGYEFTSRVEEKTQATIRGGIVDIWPPSELWPIRIELFSHTVESIRKFDPASQTSVEKLTSVCILPASEFIVENKKLKTLLPYLANDSVIIWSDIKEIEYYDSLFHETTKEKSLTEVTSSLKSLRSGLSKRKDILQLSGSDQTKNKCPVTLVELSKPFDLVDFITCHSPKLKIQIYFHTEGSLHHFKKQNKALLSKESKTELFTGIISEGFISKDLNLAIISESDLHGHCKLIDQSYHPFPGKTRPARTTEHRISDFNNLEPDDLVIHTEYGLGRYRGLFEINFNNRLQEVLTIEYADKAKLHVPVSHANLLTRYVGSSQRSVRLHKLHSKRWKMEKNDAEQSIFDLAAVLIETQAERDHLKGHKFKQDNEWQREFEASFPYHETADQHKVIDAVKADMEGSSPMDRLICGDAGYGKTEVAMRAAFKAVMEGKQVAVLVPTTVLSLQHFQTFTDRMAPYPIRIEMLSRFCTRKTHSKIIEELAEGSIDIVIGTHSLLQSGISFKDLGVVVIDEEQRFGVEHKEHFKQMRKLVDVLTMTATPIPRTLYLSMTGARDISLLQSPPRERMSIKTIISRSEDDVIREAILREVNRDGQVFFLHNRVMTIERTKDYLQRIVPEAKIRIGHGQMPTNQLSEVIHDFVDRKFDVLLCTTIIESGMDIPNANTIIIDRADRFGIADLYQLRGRVGRSSRQAYAYLLIPSHGKIEPEARQRIAAIKKYSGLSAGFSLAIRDLEIRGAGNLLGAAQSGHITAIGFNMYCQILKRAVLKLQGNPVPPIVDVEILLDFISLSANSLDAASSAAIPYEYIEDETTRIDIYRRFAELSDRADIRSLIQEISDRFGSIPPPVSRLIVIAEIRLLCAERGISSIEARAGKLLIRRNNDYIKPGSRFPLLKTTIPDHMLEEIREIILKLP